ncbi:cytidylyltransferase domain-containing protein [Candidatus Pelagibacter sp. HIMB1748]|uniref:cytidylyltransferase domain-containing protein n=1 Tax=unclassified Candidatus Pelagibacter TaxID=2647897 RepID=UPI003F828026
MKIGILISARDKSKRLKKKLFLKVSGFSIFEYLLIRAKNLNKYAKIILATSKDQRDLKLINIAKKYNLDFFKGHKDDKLKRYYNAAIKFNLDGMIIIDADDPLFFTDLIIKQIKLFKKKKYDFIYFDTKHVGISCNFIKTKALKYIIGNKKKRNTEVWGHYFLNNKKIIKKKIKFNIKSINKPIRLTLDYEEDYKLIKKIINKLKNKTDFNDDQLINFLKFNKKLLNINSSVVSEYEKHLALST